MNVCNTLGPLPFMDISADLKLPKFLNATSVSIQTGDLGFPIGNSTQNEVYVRSVVLRIYC